METKLFCVLSILTATLSIVNQLPMERGRSLDRLRDAEKARGGVGRKKKSDEEKNAYFIKLQKN